MLEDNLWVCHYFFDSPLFLLSDKLTIVRDLKQRFDSSLQTSRREYCEKIGIVTVNWALLENSWTL
jgi:hypothetical protein